MYNSFLSVRWCTWWNNNFFLTKYKGCTGEYWCEVMAVWTKLSMVCTKITKGQYCPVWLKQAKLLSSLLYETWTKLVYSEFSAFVNWSTWQWMFLWKQSAWQNSDQVRPTRMLGFIWGLPCHLINCI